MFKFGCKSSCQHSFLGKSKKQVAIAERHQELLMLAREIIALEGFHSFTMDKLAAKSAYSKGTIYNHFNSKEDVIVALSIESMKFMESLFKRAYEFQGSSRERMVALHVAYNLFSKLEPVMFLCVLTSKTPWVMEKCDPENLEKSIAQEERLIAVADQFITDAVSAGDLQLSPTISSDTLIFANWAVAFGTNALINSAKESRCIEPVLDPFTALYNINIMLDGMQWLPLSSKWDYKKVWLKVEETIFADEVACLKASNSI
ncbi:TetR/AcrR family transcriptional regulator [Pseudoalteromonas xiamenensis]|uniref:TetR/AcrR family transcriptional regulator n=1 Tax=Pseudoalteromonas xiamenensis TaxID=882626 RepID=A0A975HL97_9GAMM|nr:TetR/AcrR family transcriptional regulator [Pseudoalteromonas xiamenensis]QTH71858.1 TetR/AcrR family transcriptional regulator [Pseudoalteromonas xiamenensis]